MAEGLAARVARYRESGFDGPSYEEIWDPDHHTALASLPSELVYPYDWGVWSYHDAIVEGRLSWYCRHWRCHHGTGAGPLAEIGRGGRLLLPTVRATLVVQDGWVAWELLPLEHSPYIPEVPFSFHCFKTKTGKQGRTKEAKQLR